MAVQIQWRRGTAAQWTAANPTLASGEVGLETDTGKFKIGDGSTAWNSLAYGIGDHGNLVGLADDDHPQYVRHNLATADNDMLVGQVAGSWIKKTLAEIKTILGLGGTVGGNVPASTAESDFLTGNGATGNWQKKTLAEAGAILEADLDHGNIQGLGDDDHTQYIKHALATAASDFLVASGAGAFVKKTLVEALSILAPSLGKAADLDADPNTAVVPVLVTSHANTPLGGAYWYIFTMFYSAISSTGNRSQIAIGYNPTTGDKVYHRHCYSTTWSAWNPIWTAATDGSGSGLDADKVDGIEGAALLALAGGTMTGDLHSTATYPLIIKRSGYKSWALHHMAGTRIIFVQSTSVDGVDWDWNKTIEFDGDDIWQGPLTKKFFRQGNHDEPTDWTNVTYSAGNFSGMGSMTWTVAEADVVLYRYKMLSADTMILQFNIGLSSVGGTPSYGLKIAIPNSKVAAGAQKTQAAYCIDNGVVVGPGRIEAIDGAGYVVITSDKDATNWSVSTNTTYVEGQIIIKVA